MPCFLNEARSNRHPVRRFVNAVSARPRACAVGGHSALNGSQSRRFGGGAQQGPASRDRRYQQGKQRQQQQRAGGMEQRPAANQGSTGANTRSCCRSWPLAAKAAVYNVTNHSRYKRLQVARCVTGASGKSVWVLREDVARSSPHSDGLQAMDAEGAISLRCLAVLRWRPSWKLISCHNVIWQCRPMAKATPCTWLKQQG